ncbi:MFS transporter [Cupriavidus sp. USMAA2-4]|uniref:MFS transporter n=1 Tax=Cupriavidus malaysiensis TaxID=367825 RepID=A0ABM6FEQ1_9BURK|nr:MULTISPECIES: MFS transporter [Cupriavidus]AOY94797.1 MFS transporter [Cupriavidus sp. USMAA2-4]AOZ02341.1 MFS transporter [Cupriavidus sp. USMAHM13]AOZ10285.1 MFS transporter [Cupriavidus malaysiensis]
MTITSREAPPAGQVLPFWESLMAMFGIAFVVMLVALDQTVVGTALPTVVAELQGFEYYAWVATAYLLASVITVPIFGRLGDYYGRKPFVMASIIVFTGASALCGMATSMPFLVLARALQGIGGGMLVGTAFACIPDLFPDSHVRLRWQVMMSAAFGIANAIGPSLGGVLTEWYGWRAVFYVNLPVGLLGLVFAWRYLPHLRHQSHAGPIRVDWLGAALIGLGLGSLQLSVELLPRHGFGAGTVGLLLLAVAALVGLWHWERRSPNPILPLDMFRNPGLAPLFLLAVLVGFTMFSLLLYAPLLFQGGFGYSPKEAGLLVTPLVVCITVGSILNGRIITRVRNPNAMLYAGFIMLALACLGLSQATRDMSRHLLLALMLVGGFGLGFIMPNLTVFAQQTAGRTQLGIATAMLQSLRMVGGMAGTALIGTLVDRRYADGVRAALAGAGANDWMPRLGDPQVLIDKAAQSGLLAQLHQAGHNGALLLEQARLSLVGAIHLGLVLGAVVAALGIWLARRVPPIKLERAVKQATMAAE